VGVTVEARVESRNGSTPPELEGLVRQELEPVVRELVRRVALELTREELERLASSLSPNGGATSPAEMVLRGPERPQDLTRALPEAPRPSSRPRRDGDARRDGGEATPDVPTLETRLRVQARPERVLRLQAGEETPRIQAGSRPGRRGERDGAGAGVTLTFAELLRGGDPERLRFVLDDELRRGRVRLVGDAWAIVPQAFEPGVLEGLRQFNAGG
jgi:hypothetical protein